MTDLPLDTDPSEHIETSVSASDGLSVVLTWLDASPPANAEDDLAPLQNHLSMLRGSKLAPQQRAMVLERIYTRGITVLDALRPTLTDVSLPLSKKVRPLVRRLQDLLRSLAEDLLATPTLIEGHMIRGLRELQATLLWRSLYALSQHLLISNLTAGPAGTGIWSLLHQTYATARKLKVAHITPEGSASTPQDLYFSAVLLGCSQPASFTSREVEFVAAYLEHFSDRIDLSDVAPVKLNATFWIDPARDVAAFACTRKTAPTDTGIHYFSCDKLASLLKKQLAALEAGSTPQHINLPAFASTVAGRGVFRRLVTHWGDPGKRRFPRRRQNYRALLCAGLDSLWRLFQDGEEAAVDASSWMITNESPDGYAIMHVSGKTGSMSVGDVTAIRTESSENWQICIIRWAISENQVHLELGLQILATHAVPAFLAQTSETNASGRLSVLILPEIPALRATEMMVVPSGALDDQSNHHVLVVERDNVEVREVKSTQLNEQNSRIEVFSIIPAAH